MIIAAAVDEASPSHSDLLSLLLGIEGFLFAAVALAVTLSAPNQRRQPRYPKLHPEKILIGAVSVLTAVGIGALASWSAIFTGGSYEGLTRAIEAGALLLGIAAQPAIALLLTLSARRE